MNKIQLAVLMNSIFIMIIAISAINQISAQTKEAVELKKVEEFLARKSTVLQNVSLRKKNRITFFQRKAAAENIKAARAMALDKSTGTVTALKATMPSSPTMPGGDTPHYFGPYPNYANSPMPKGFITSILVVDQGINYTAPVVEISDVYGTGSGATASATVVGGMISDITITDEGTGYTAPVVTISDATGSDASAIALIGGASDSLSGGIKKFIDSLAVMTDENTNTLNQYIPIAVPDTEAFAGSDYYEIALVQYTQQFHSNLPETLLRGYVQLETQFQVDALVSRHITLINPDGSPILKSDGSQAYGVDEPRYLGPIIVANRDIPVRIKFSNLLPTNGDGNLFIPVDTTVMGAGMGPLDMAGMPGMKEMYTQNRATLHLHGGFVPWISDGTPHQWTAPAGEMTPYPKGVSVKNVPDMLDPGDGSLTFYYNNQQSARLQFYHDHSYGITRLNVYAGEAAGYVITDDVDQDLINGTNVTEVNPDLLQILPDIGIPLIIQDKTFMDETTIGYQDPNWRWGLTPGMPNTGDLWLPSVYMPAQNPYDLSGANAFGRWQYGPYFWPPTTGITHPPIENPYYNPADPDNPMEPPTIPDMPNPSMGMEAFMDTPLINGTAYPYLEVDPKAYRFRILNAANDRFFNLQMYVADSDVTTSDGRINTEVKMVPAIRTLGYPSTWPRDGRDGGAPDPTTRGPSWIQIGTEGGFLPAPVVIPNQPINWNMNATAFNVGNVTDHSLLLGCAERADVIVDFSAFRGKTIILYNDAPAAFPALDPRYDYYTGNPDQTDTGGTPPTQPGYGPNTRTIMQIRVRDVEPASTYDLTALRAVFAKTLTKRGVFEVSQNSIIIPQAAYNSAYNETFPASVQGQYVQIFDFTKTFTPVSSTTPVAIHFENKAIHDEMGATYDQEYGRMSGTFGLELIDTNNLNQNFLLYGYASPPVDILQDTNTLLGTTTDGIEIWKITHNGVDTHPIHFHLMNVQLINRVAWDNAILPPDPNELGWKETIRMNPLEDCIVAMKPEPPTQPFDIPNSVRLIDPTMPEGELLVGPPGGFTDPTAEPVEVINHYVNFGWEYMWHCHILSHEEMDMMHALSFAVAPQTPSNLAVSLINDQALLTWTDNSISETGFTIQRATDSSFTVGLTSFAIESDVTAYTDTTVLPYQTTYYYRIFASNTIGDTEIYVAPAVGFPTKTVNSEFSGTAILNQLPPPPSIIIDNRDGPSSVIIIGSWTTSNSSSSCWGPNYLHDKNTGKGKKSVRFIPNILVAGQYQVSIWYSSGSNRAKDVPVDIVYATGTKTVKVNQRVQGGRWVPLGIYTFLTGKGGSLRIRNTGATGYVIADAVKFEWMAP
jgi:FtsP/CotA-like multicopper oxidase with cupredoxin domain